MLPTDIQQDEIKLADAARKYALPKSVISKWIQSGALRVLRREGRNVFLSDKEVKERAAYFYEQRRQSGGRRTRVFDAQGNPIPPKNR